MPASHACEGESPLGGTLDPRLSHQPLAREDPYTIPDFQEQLGNSRKRKHAEIEVQVGRVQKNRGKRKERGRRAAPSLRASGEPLTPSDPGAVHDGASAMGLDHVLHFWCPSPLHLRHNPQPSSRPSPWGAILRLGWTVLDSEGKDVGVAAFRKRHAERGTGGHCGKYLIQQCLPCSESTFGRGLSERMIRGMGDCARVYSGQRRSVPGSSAKIRTAEMITAQGRETGCSLIICSRRRERTGCEGRIQGEDPRCSRLPFPAPVSIVL